MCEVTLENEYIDVPLHSLQLAPPSENCGVEIINGYHAGESGSVRAMNESEIVVLLNGKSVLIDKQNLFVLVTEVI